MRRATIVLAVVAAAAASAVPGTAEATPWAAVLPDAGFCVPAPSDPAAVPTVTGAAALGAPATKPVAILDTGVDATAPDLAGRVLPGIDAATGAPAAGDPDGHGTELAGMVAGAGGGVLGASPGSPILPVTIYGPDRSTTAETVAKGINRAVQAGAGVIVLGAAAAASDVQAGSAIVGQAIDAAFSAGVLVVAPAGDSSAAAQTMPGGLPHVIEVGSAGADNLRATTSNFGPWLDLIAPGEGVYGPLPQATCLHGFGFSAGTGFAVAPVAGVAAELQAMRPQLTTEQLFELVRRSTVDEGPVGRDDDSGFGFLSAGAGRTAAPQPKEGSPEVDDDPIWVRGKYAAAHPPVLTASKLRFKLLGTVSPAKDPADVYPVRLAARQRMVVTLNASDKSSVLGLAILRSGAGDFDVSGDVADNVAAATDGLSSYSQLEVTAKRAATFYIAVEAADAVDPDDPTAVAPPLEPYQLSAFSQRKKAKAAKKRHR